MFSEAFRQKLEMGKYTNWAANLTESHMEALLWLIGEYGFRAPLVLKLLEKDKKEGAIPDIAFARAKFALETIFRVVLGKRLDLEEATRRLREVLKKERASEE